MTTFIALKDAVEIARRPENDNCAMFYVDIQCQQCDDKNGFAHISPAVIDELWYDSNTCDECGANDFIVTNCVFTDPDGNEFQVLN